MIQVPNIDVYFQNASESLSSHFLLLNHASYAISSADPWKWYGSFCGSLVVFIWLNHPNLWELLVSILKAFYTWLIETYPIPFHFIANQFQTFFEWFSTKNWVVFQRKTDWFSKRKFERFSTKIWIVFNKNLNVFQQNFEWFSTKIWVVFSFCNVVLGELSRLLQDKMNIKAIMDKGRKMLAIILVPIVITRYVCIFTPSVKKKPLFLSSVL